ncbi:MAG: hypothetical protein HQM12_02520 [SAR324 cluster bacterium]|nr:hypothetical protein [SAR324 cluster bacterium]MBF0353250.1 hypothetical protein [SAR324 cluster bacterium]
MHGFMNFRFLWLIPLVFLVILLFRKIFLQSRKLNSPKEQSLPGMDHPTSVKSTSSEKIPEELKQAGLQVLDSLDWDIRFLEKQRLEETDPIKRQELEEKLKQKKAEYHTTVERLNL